jgi:hypothetical protein
MAKYLFWKLSGVYVFGIGNAGSEWATGLPVWRDADRSSWQSEGMSVLKAPADAAEDFSLQQAVREQVSRWSATCQEFLDWQKREILGPHEPSAEKMEQHRAGLKWLLRFGRAMYLTASDPDYPDSWIRAELNGRVIQLEHSWRLVHEPMVQEEATGVLREVFPE